MTDTSRNPAKAGKAAPTKAQHRADRLKAALKANVARRKAQAKARDDEPSGPDTDRQQETE